MQDWVLEVMEQFGYAGVLLLMTLENIFPPIPSEIILLFGGFMTTYTGLTILGVMITATTGSLIGAIILYGIGRLIHVEKLERGIDRWGRFIRVKKEDLHKANEWFATYGYWAVFICRMIPIARSIISVPAGMSGMTFWLFLLLTMVGTMIWNIILVIAGAMLGVAWKDLIGFFDVYSLLIYIFLFLSLIILLLFYVGTWKKR